jgi:fibronectin type 3 domain-containing protein
MKLFASSCRIINLVRGLLLFLLLGGAVKPSPAQTNVVGQWSAVQSWPFRAIHMALLPTGRVIFWSRYPEAFNPYLWNPTDNALTPIAGPGYQEFCSSMNFLADGRLFIMGGHNTQDGDGLPFATIYDSFSNSYTRTPSMNNGRWYPSSVVMPNNDVVVMSGSYGGYSNNDLPQVFNGTSWRDLTSARMALPLYPDILMAPNGKVFLLGPDQATRYLDTSGTGSWSFVANRTFPNRDYGSYCFYDNGKVFYAGGGDPPTNTAEVIDLNAATPTWRQLSSRMVAARRQMNCTLLPDGKILITGGVSGAGFNDTTTPVLQAEIWDPATEQFTRVASMAVGRWYHSTIALLPDGRLISAGGDGQFNAEIYSPPYLFKGARPTITSAPASVNFGQNFDVVTPEASGIAQVTLLRLTSVTHSNNFDQRILRPTFTRGSGRLTVTAPSNPALCPAGYYMLFVLNGTGVPSVARMVRIGAAPAVPAAPTNLTASGGDQRVTLSWTPSVGATGYTVRRGTSATGPFNTTVASNVNASIYTHTGLTNGTTYHYVVNATNSAGTSPQSNVASATPQGPINGTGTGLQGQYFNNRTLTAPALVTRVDPLVNFDWGSGSPAAGIGVDNFSVRWIGRVMPRYSEPYTFITTSDDGIRLWVNNVLLVDNWTDHAPTENTGLINLIAGQNYDIKIEFYENGGGAVSKLEWQSPSQTREPVATSQLYPPGTGQPPAAPTNLVAVRGDRQIVLNWTASATATSYTVKRSTTNGGPYANVATNVTRTDYTDAGLTNGTTYYYVVSARNADGESPNSNQASATPAAPSTASAVFVRTDTTTQGNWKGAYGSQGYNVLSDRVQYPIYATVNPLNTNDWIWDGNPSDPKCLLRASATSGRISACQYNGQSLTYNISLTSGLTRQIALYHLDHDNFGRSLRVEVRDLATGTLLDSRSLSGFSQGAYLVWNVSGSVSFQIINTGGANAVISGLFFDAPGVVDTPPPPTNLAATAGGGRVNLTWTGVGQATAYNVKRATSSGGPYTTIASGVPSPAYTDTGVTNGTTYYYVVTATNSRGEGIPSNEASATPSGPASATATFVRTDSTTQGSWRGVYGTQGYNVIADSVSYPSYATVSASGNNVYTWVGSTGDVRALQKANASDRLAACWYNSSNLGVSVALTAGTTRNIALYCLDWDNTPRAMRIEVRDANTDALLNQQNVTGFANGQYLVWRVTGAVTFRLVPVSGSNCVLSGIFFDP